MKYTQLEMLRKVVRTAQELEKDSHREKTGDKEASWLLKYAKEADMQLDDDLKLEINNKLSGKKRLAVERGDLEFDEMITKGEKAPLHRNKEEQRKKALKLQYKAEKEKELTRKFANSSYLTPESITYLNEVIKKSETSVD